MSGFQSAVDEIKRELSAAEQTVKIVSTDLDWSGEVVRTDTGRASGVTADKVKSIILEKIVEQDVSSEAERGLRALFKSIKEVLPRVTESIKTVITRKKGGYSEYTWWWETVNSRSGGDIEMVDLDKLNREIDEFSRQFQVKK